MRPFLINSSSVKHCPGDDAYIRLGTSIFSCITFICDTRPNASVAPEELPVIRIFEAL